ncbi:probable peroxisomal acyl-coenzyme A oxidase 1 [Bombyx mori]|uniref:Acyl-coenzyme A oxidase n=1 Tax=Bombyx mori TaxID=7091 RepID=A0A8R2AL51_BOMMO|nr:probable peroxisomal acyl-coenzyme A oxidase 1 [Bombyx mori]
MSSVNPDLVKERQKCTFDVQELVHFIDRGEEHTLERKELEDLVLSVKELKDETPEEYLSHKERYENAIRKASLLFKILQKYFETHNLLDIFSPTNKYRVQFGVLKDVSPFLVHMGMFLPTLLHQTTPEQAAEWVPKAQSMQMIGTYAQTELGHGTFLRGLETTATYDAKAEEFILNTPTLTSFKWWPGGLAHTANHCVVVAQLYTKGKCYGVHPFLVQIRDLETHMPMPGIKIGEIGSKLGYNTVNNGFLGFNKVRIPRTNLLMKNAQVLKDGTYVKAKSEKLTYGTMVLIRVLIVTDMAYELARASTVAVRYSVVRHQSQPKPGQPEPQIIEYVTQQHKLFIAVATSHVYRITGHWLWDTYYKVTSDLDKGNLEQLPELHAVSCCLKAVCSRDASIHIDDCRLACGGHGYMKSSSFPFIQAIVTASVTYEGEYTVMMLQTARYLMKTLKQALSGKAITSTVAYLLDFDKNSNRNWQNTPEGIVIGFQAIAAGLTKAAYDEIEKHEKTGLDYEDSWNQASVQLVRASEAHCRVIICEKSWLEAQRLTKSLSPALSKVLLELVELYIIYWALEKKGDFLVYTKMQKDDVMQLQQRYEELLAVIRPNAVGLVDGFDIRDEILNSTLGAYDGRVYERLMEEALKSPLNAEPVNTSFHQYLKPFMTAKL